MPHGTPALYASAVTDPLAPFRARPQASGVFLDFDGTLSEIVPVPSEARPAAGVPELLARLADRHGLTVHEGRKSFELRPPVELSKATVVLDRAREAKLEAVMFVGDDTVDLPAFGALDELAARGVATLRVAVRSDEAPEALLRRADVVVEGPPGVVEYLEQLAP